MGVVLVIAGLVLFLFVPEAGAAFVGSSGRYVTFSAPPGQNNDVVIVEENGWVVFRDTGAAVDVEYGGPCEQLDANSARCPMAGVENVSVSLEDRDDAAVVRLLRPPVGQPRLDVGLSGGDGADRLSSEGDTDDRIGGGFGDDILAGGEGADELDGGPGRDRLDGGAGNDQLQAGFPAASRYGERSGEGADDFRGGPGVDHLYYSGLESVRVTLDDRADDGREGEGDQVSRDVEAVHGGLGADVLVGSEASELLYGGEGDDAIAGLGGRDALDGGNGADLLDAGDGDDIVFSGDGHVTCEDLGKSVRCPGTPNGADAIVCGAGHDHLERDPVDVADVSCERPFGASWAPEPDPQPALLVPAVGQLASPRSLRLIVACAGRRRCRGTLSLAANGRRIVRRRLRIAAGRVSRLRLELDRPVSTSHAMVDASFRSVAGKTTRRTIILRRG